jgi:hypothetical protein
MVWWCHLLFNDFNFHFRVLELEGQEHPQTMRYPRLYVHPSRLPIRRMLDRDIMTS